MTANDPSVVQLIEVSLRYNKTCAVDAVTLDIPANRMVGLIGPDGREQPLQLEGENEPRGTERVLDAAQAVAIPADQRVLAGVLGDHGLRSDSPRSSDVLRAWRDVRAPSASGDDTCGEYWVSEAGAGLSAGRDSLVVRCALLALGCSSASLAAIVGDADAFGAPRFSSASLSASPFLPPLLPFLLTPISEIRRRFER